MEIRHRSSRSRSASLQAISKIAICVVSLLFVAICGSIAYVTLQNYHNNESSNHNYGSNNSGGSDTTRTSTTQFLSSMNNRNGPTKSGLHIPVFYPKYVNNNNVDTTAQEEVLSMMYKLEQDLQNSPIVSEIVALDSDNPPAYMKTCGTTTTAATNTARIMSTTNEAAGLDASSSAITEITISNNAYERLQILKESKQPHLALELLKYCTMEHYGGGLYVDSQSALTSTLDFILSKPTAISSTTNLAVLNDSNVAQRLIHSAMLYIANNNNDKTNTGVVQGMIQILMTTNLQILESSPLLLPKSLHDLISTETTTMMGGGQKLIPGNNDKKWYLLQHTCNLSSSLGQRQVTAPISSYTLNSHRLTQNCPEPNGFCCSVYDSVSHLPAMMTKHLILPYQILPPASQLPRPLNAETGHFDEEDLPYISTISESVHPRPEEPPLTPNFFEILLQNDCLPSDKKCSDCLRNKQGANCKQCASVCPCYCKALCHIPVEEKFVSKSLVIKPPLYARDPTRLIPRIVHQTFFENVTPEKYPNMSRLIESFKQSGWKYKFYTDDMSLNFLSTHFPPEVREAYEALRPGAFKADLFRYCVLLIHGGVYADMDIMLESNLDLAVGPDVGFMVPQDEPGTPIDRRMCLWNGFIAAAPGHPFLAKVIQTVVNNVRNRFTSVDTDHLFCPDPEMSILHAFDTLFTAGPCILGAMVNKVLGRNGQAPFEAGEMDLWESSKQAALEKGTQFVIGVDDKPNKKIPGRTIILHQNKWDMGSHRFTLLDKNLVVAATDLPDADDRANQEKPPEHYSKTHVKAGIYGLDRLYTDNVRANEELQFYVDAQWSKRV